MISIGLIVMLGQSFAIEVKDFRPGAAPCKRMNGQRLRSVCSFSEQIVSGKRGVMDLILFI